MRGLIVVVMLVAAFVSPFFILPAIEPAETKSGVVIGAEYLNGGIRVPATILKYDDGSTFVVNQLHDVTLGYQTVVRGKWRQDVREWIRPQ